VRSMPTSLNAILGGWADYVVESAPTAKEFLEAITSSFGGAYREGGCPCSVLHPRIEVKPANCGS